MTRPHRPDHDDQRLRHLLADAVADIWPADRLAAITARTRERAEGKESTMRNRSLAIAGAVVTSAAVITAAAWAGGAFDPSPDEPPRAATDTSSTAPATGPAATTEPTPDPLQPRPSDAEPSPTVTAPAPAPSTPTPVPEETGGASPSPDRAPAGTRAAGIYFTGEGPDGPRLFREFQQVPASDPTAAVNVAVQGRAQDPDYRSSWRGVVDRVARVSTPATGAEGIPTVQFPAGADVRSRPSGMSRREARVAVQQIVRTVQAYSQDRVGVAFTVADETSGALDTVLGVPANGGRGEFVAAPALEVLNHVSITNPAEGATADGTLDANGRASSFEATVPWEIRRDGRVVKEGSVMAEGWMGRLYPWRTRIDVSGLSPGTYTFVAMTSDPSGGAEGPGPHTDTRTFRVR